MKTYTLILIAVLTLSFGNLKSQNYSFTDFTGTWQGYYSSDINDVNNLPITMEIQTTGYYTETTGYFMPDIYPNTQEVTYDAATNRVHWKYLSTVYSGQSFYTHIFYEVISFSNDTLVLYYNFWDDPQPSPDFGTLVLVRQGVTTGIAGREEDIQIQIYPNPASDKLHISTESRMERILLFNANAQLSLSVEPGNNEYIMKLQNLSKGYYILQIETENKLINKKISIQ